jgi:hypothetical protein
MLLTNLAFLKIAKRAERQDDEVLRRTFVDFGHVLAALSSIDHQIVFGRRGTGKTHLLTVLRQERAAADEAVVQLDMRNLGSAGGIYGDTTLPIAQRATRLLIDVLAAIHGRLFELAIENPDIVDLGRLGNALDDFFDAHRSVRVVGETTVESTTSLESSGTSEAKFGVLLGKSPAFSAGESLASSAKDLESSKTVVKGAAVHRVNFGRVGDALRNVVDLLPSRRLWILIDEWSEVPHDLQPLLADLIRRAVLPLRGVYRKDWGHRAAK